MQILFVQGGGEGAYLEDKKLADDLQARLGNDYTVHYPPMPDEDSPNYGAWKTVMQQTVCQLSGDVIYVGHSFGASLVLKALVEGALDFPSALFLLAAPYWGGQDWDVSDYELPENFADKLSADLPIFLYHSHDDQWVSFTHLERYAQKLPQATVREFDDRGHQFHNDLSEVAQDISTILNASLTAVTPLLIDLLLVESPRWRGDRLWFSDWAANELRAVDLTGTSEVITKVPTFPFCFDWLPDGRLLVVSGREALLLCMEANGSLATYVDLSAFSTHPWNEVVVDGRGNTYINNTGFDFPMGEFAPGFIVLVRPDGSVEKVADGVAFPNGMAITPDNRTLILAESYGNCLTAFDIAADGTLSNRRVWAHCEGDHPDGICIDAEGAVWYADVGNKRCVRVQEGGEILQTVEVDRGCFACMLGGAAGKTLFILANDWRGPESLASGERAGQVLTIEVNVPHAGWP